MNRHLTQAVSTSIDSQVARAADEFLEQLGRGETPDLQDFVRRYPQIASVLPEVLPVLRMIQTLAPNDQESVGILSESEPALLGEFRLLREIGRGGMGVVYEAEQVSLGRQVALKVLPVTAGFDSKQLARFQIEAQVVAALHHPHIVPIFAVGCDRGVHYHAMQLIEGHSLADILSHRGNGEKDAAAGIPLAPREAALLALQAAEALEHAHALGVLHRDIKPANLLRDTRGHLWVTDFGLARFQNGGNLTRSGDLLGTLRYMSPEQAAGGRVLDPRTDVYSLGATLYELLAARPAFDSDDRQEILRQIADVDPVPLRKLDPTIPRDLETIVGKAIAKEPERRYTTAQELADDLRRFLEDKPIRARRPNLAEQVARWSRRHRRTTTAAAALAVLLALASAGGLARLWKEQRQTRAALEKAKEAQSRERQALIFTFAASDQIVDRALTMIAVPSPSHTNAEAEQYREFCRMALKYYQGIAARYDADPEMLAIAAAANHRVGMIRAILNEPSAQHALDRSIAIYQKLIADSPRSHDLRSHLALTYGDLLFLSRRTNSPAAILHCLERLVAARQGLADDFPDDRDNRISLIYHQVELTDRLEAAGRPVEAAEVRRHLVENAPQALEFKPDDHRLRNNLAWSLASRANASISETILAVKLAKEATSLTPKTGGYWNTLGVAHYRVGDWKAAATAIEQSMNLRSGGDAYDWLFLAMAKWRLGEQAQARRWHERSVQWIETNASRNQELLEFQAESARLLK